MWISPTHLHIRFRELKPLEAWECRQARRSGKILLNGRMVKGKVGVTESHTMFLSGGLDDDNRCEVGMVTLPDGKVLNGLASQGLYDITLREEFARLNEVTGSLTLTSGVQAWAADKSIVDSWRARWCGNMTPWTACRPSSGFTEV
jgi:hypothetical protein